jgi:hypothetical protein
MSTRVVGLLKELGGLAALPHEQQATLVRSLTWVDEMESTEVVTLLNGLAQLEPPTSKESQAVWGAVFARLQQRFAMSQSAPLDGEIRAQVGSLYQQLGKGFAERHHLLAILATSNGEEDLKRFAELIATEPPRDTHRAVMAFVPLFRRTDYPVEALFPRVLDGIGDPHVAAVVLDLANYVTRRSMVATHPATDRCAQLAGLLGGLVRQLEDIPQTPPSNAEEVMATRQRVAEAVSLCVSLCDSLALIGDLSVLGTLRQTLGLGHRQLRTEAAAALTRLGDGDGRKKLVELAAEPLVRLKVLSYADELGIGGEIDAKHRTAEALAEASLVGWLALPTQFGVPPRNCEHIDSRKMYWPGYSEPIDCHLFCYSYETHDGLVANVGIAGPLVHSFRADLTGLPVDDVYAAFAGWHAEHEEVFEVDWEQLSADSATVAEAVRGRLEGEGYDDLKVAFCAMFFGSLIVIATASRGRTAGTVVADAEMSHWCPRGDGPRPLGPQEAYSIYKGRKLLAAFNE